MDRNSEEYKKLKAEYEAKEQYRKDHPEEYPWFAYFQFGFHNMTYLSDEEVQDAVKFYRLYETHSEDGKKEYIRYGRQPITIIERG